MRTKSENAKRFTYYVHYFIYYVPIMRNMYTPLFYIIGAYYVKRWFVVAYYV